MTALDDYLRLIQLHCEVYHNQQVCGNWVIEEHEEGQTCFHLVSHGRCRLEVGQASTILETGDVVLFPREVPHRLVPLAGRGPARRLPMTQDWQEDATGLLCAAIQFEHRASEPLLNAWPTYLIVRRDAETARWLMPLLEQLVAVSREAGPGSRAIVDRLAEVVFMQVLRHRLSDPEQTVGFVAAYAHPRLGPAMSAFHATADQAWTLAEAAARAHQSRAQFARTFKTVTGWTWLRYQNWWRMQLAWSKLERGESVIETALSVGYRSEAAFSRAFSRHFGCHAGAVRRAYRNGNRRPDQDSSDNHR
ncbi:AraC family transcriptional regulator [Saccharospirillum salsuginis]|uniref:Transcriptional regulator n=1 Tax=Saccharospirillum salsuginis TaxID=418750 RepID=A0A918NIU3_9GAMM|nr:AraC family transcriptional regulator [Saccharospirillum salsuginis]GGX70766.1 transcriptional regulator [Saccharospirillum salsuginis]